MATSTFFKDIYIDDKAADILIAGLERERKPHIPALDIDKELKRGSEAIKAWLSRSERQSEQI